jgi:uncharacterized BrkB/YihY/UPF0761 family membrane protein
MESTIAADTRPSRPRRALGELIGLYWDSGLGNDVPALAWFLLSSLVPLALGITALAAVVLRDYAQAQAIAEHASSVLPKDVHDEVVQLILRTNRDSPLLIAGAIAVMLWTTSGAVGVIQRVLERLLELPGSGVVIGKLRNLGVSAALTMLIVLLVLVASEGTGILRQLEIDSLLARIVVPVVSLAITVTICATVFWSLTVGRVRYHCAVGGGVVAAIILLVTPTAAGYYLRYVAGATPVKLFLMLAGVLITCFLVALGLLLGAGVTARLQLGRRLGSPAPVAAESANAHVIP